VLSRKSCGGYDSFVEDVEKVTEKEGEVDHVNMKWNTAVVASMHGSARFRQYPRAIVMSET
jgi:hypothetical protein